MKAAVPPASSFALRLLAASIVAAAAMGWSGGTRAQPTGAAPQTTTAQGVTIKVTPKPLPAGATEWEFGVVLDTHSSSLDDDLAKTATLIVNGKEVAPTGWTGAAPGGHHREGVLKFPVPAGQPSAAELRIRRPGETEPRVFRWDAAALR